MNSLFNRWLPAATLALWGGAILVYSFDGRIKNVLAPEFRIYAVIAAVLLLLGALVFVFSRSADVSCCGDSACAHGLSRFKSGKLLTFTIILLPIGLSLVASPQALSDVQKRNRTMIDDVSSLQSARRTQSEKRQSDPARAQGDGIVVPGPVAGPPPLPLPKADGSTAPAEQPKHPAAAEPTSLAEYLQKTPEGNIIAEVLDLLYAAQDPVLRKDFEGKKVQLIVQYMPDSAAGPAAHRFKGVRMFMTCCAADARPIATLIESEKTPEFPEMSWVKVVGTATFPIEKGRRISVVQAQRIEKVDPPEDGMLY